MDGNAPIGYRSKKVQVDHKNVSILEIDPSTIDIVKRIFAMYTEENCSLYEIVTYLNNRSITTQKDVICSHKKMYSHKEIESLY